MRKLRKIRCTTAISMRIACAPCVMRYTYLNTGDAERHAAGDRHAAGEASGDRRRRGGGGRRRGGGWIEPRGVVFAGIREEGVAFGRGGHRSFWFVVRACGLVVLLLVL